MARNRQSMDKTIKSTPIIVLADWYQFTPGERAVRTRVESRMFLWCRQGRGRLLINGRQMDFVPDDWVMLPWHHHIEYEADHDHPFMIGGIHVIPSHVGNVPVRFHGVYRTNGDVGMLSGRHDRRIRGLEGIIRGRFNTPGDPLQLLAHYIVERFQHSKPNRSLMTHLGYVLIEELIRSVGSRPSDELPPSPTMRRLRDFVEAHLDRPLSIADLAGSADCGEATVFREFRRHLQLSPARWIARQRARHAAILLRTTTLSVKEIGRRVGFVDPFHFSRQFKREMGASPRLYRLGKPVL
ncbi:MAG: helix-turn-helix transcriptional regulator [Phycisphaerales bacterium]|jgi:AraC-like DNA-binding protein|nr:helix-turn-helix transcriptional regulator [Phycisphaerales bacterium]